MHPFRDVELDACCREPPARSAHSDRDQHDHRDFSGNSKVANVPDKIAVS